MAKKPAETPLMKQYNRIKSKHPDAVLLFRVGDFYETFAEDAVKAADILGITLTRRANGAADHVELAGFPYHALDTYLPKLVHAGQRVAICEQLEDPKQTKKIVKRGVTELITPGVALGDHILNHKENNFLAAVHIERNSAGVSFLDLSTGEFYLSEGTFIYIDKLLSAFHPKEILYERSKKDRFLEIFGDKYFTYKLEDWAFTRETSEERLLHQFDTQSLKGFGVQDLSLGITAAGAVLQYLDLTEHKELKHITRISRIDEEAYVHLDTFTIRNLELFRTGSPDGKSLLDTLDKTVSPPGSRLLKRQLSMPLKNIQAINERLDLVEYMIRYPSFTDTLRKLIKQTGDLERINAKIASGKVNPKELLQLKRALFAVEELKILCEEASDNPKLRKPAESLNPCYSARERLQRDLDEDAPVLVSKGKVIRPGVSEELDNLREISGSGKGYLEQMQARLIQETGISSLKIGFNNVFGYYFEVRNKYKEKVPEAWIRKQTLVSSERYINPELKQYEEKILGAEDKIAALESELYQSLVSELTDYIPVIQHTAGTTAYLDVLAGFAKAGEEYNYTKPILNDSLVLDIKNGRHPVIEQQLPPEQPYIPNDVYLDTETRQIMMITGPNMAGKSALLRQTALIVILAQIGCFVPAESAEIGYVDKIFTRVGASDNISSGESTFMVEMNEAAGILNNLSERSLVLFDELGRGTSTYDGISIAWSVVEYIHEHPKFRAKTLFATHYHELNEMERSFQRIANFNVSVREQNNKIIFLRKLVKGGSEHSFGIHVAKMAGMPQSIIRRSEQVLEDLESGNERGEPVKHTGEIAEHRTGYQMSIFEPEDPVLRQIRDRIESININELTPLQALNILNEIKQDVGL
ncbi:MAG: DNA mismatch repair protein MutS [Bacteroidia bacterium]|nr:MAG: DNA mismatch repair protein MutS [Bacteroidia bacterium]